MFQVLKELENVNRDLQMAQEQRAALAAFPAFHPKRGEYEAMLDNEIQEILKHKKRYEAQAANFSQLHTWGQV